MNPFQPGDIVSLEDFCFYVYELLDDDNEVIFVGVTNDIRVTLCNYKRPLRGKKQALYYNLPLKARIDSLHSLRMRIVTKTTSKEDSVCLRDRHIRKVMKTAKLLNSECRTG